VLYLSISDLKHLKHWIIAASELVVHVLLSVLLCYVKKTQQY